MQFVELVAVLDGDQDDALRRMRADDDADVDEVVRGDRLGRRVGASRGRRQVELRAFGDRRRVQGLALAADDDEAEAVVRDAGLDETEGLGGVRVVVSLGERDRRAAAPRRPDRAGLGLCPALQQNH